MQRPAISFATVQWPRDDSLDMICVSGEKSFYHNIHHAIRSISAEDSLVPARAWLVYDDGIPEDPNAVAVEFPTPQGLLRVGYVLPRTARVYRLQMASLGRAGETLEVLGSIVRGATSTRASVAIYLPVDFDELVRTGYHDNPLNSPAWLSDGVPVRAESVAKQDFTLDELRKISCWAAKRHCLPSLPNAIEDELRRWRGEDCQPVGKAIREFTLAYGK